MRDPVKDDLREIVEFYTLTDEEARLGKGSSQLEFERTKELLLRFLPPPPAVVVDVGGASGPYAFWLAGLGYRVHLVDRRREELAGELREAGFAAVEVFGVEGPGWLIADFDERWNETATRDEILRVARLVEGEISTIGASAHMLAVGRVS